jgi:hypothetical protein
MLCISEHVFILSSSWTTACTGIKLKVGNNFHQNFQVISPISEFPALLLTSWSIFRVLKLRMNLSLSLCLSPLFYMGSITFRLKVFLKLSPVSYFNLISNGTPQNSQFLSHIKLSIHVYPSHLKHLAHSLAVEHTTFCNASELSMWLPLILITPPTWEVCDLYFQNLTYSI